MILKGRIVGVRMAQSGKIEYVLQPEEIVEFQADNKMMSNFYKKKDGRYPMLRFEPSFVAKGNVGISEMFLLGCLLQERKELVSIRYKNTPKADGEIFTVKVDEISVGYGF